MRSNSLDSLHFAGFFRFGGGATCNAQKLQEVAILTTKLPYFFGKKLSFPNTGRGATSFVTRHCPPPGSTNPLASENVDGPFTRHKFGEVAYLVLALETSAREKIGGVSYGD